MALVGSTFGFLFNMGSGVLVGAVEAHSKWWAACLRIALFGFFLLFLLLSVLYCYFCQ